MPVDTPSQPASTSTRRGIAPIEFVMALPVLLLLMVSITWLGYSVIGQAEVTVKSRTKAWKHRFEDSAKNPLIFPADLIVATNPLYDRNKDYLSESETQPVNVSPIFNAAPAPQASSTILAGSWDFRAMDLNTPPSFELYEKALLNSVTSLAQTLLAQLKGKLTDFKKMGKKFVEQKLNELVGFPFTGGGAPPADAGKGGIDQQKQQDKANLEQRLTDLGATPTGTPVPGGELDQTIKELERLEKENGEKANAPKDPNADKEKERQAGIEQTKRRIQFLKDKRQRLESEIRDITEELKEVK